MTNRIDHTGHAHPSTTAARQACKRALETTVVTPTLDIAADLRKLNEVAAPKQANKYKLPKTTRGKVSADDLRTCVQWELHTGSGRCACGWAA